MSPIALEHVDARAKILGLVVLSAGVYRSGVAAVAVAATAVVVLYLASEPRLRGLASDMKLVLVIVAGGIVGRVATQPSAAAAFDAGVAGAKFVVVVSLAYVVASTSTSAEFEASVESAFRRLPLVRESDWAVMFGAAARFLPTVSEEARTVRRAHESRLGDRRRFDRRLRSLAYPVLVGSLRSADTLALAMASRAYSPERTRMQELEWGRREAAVVVAAAAFAAALTLL